MAVEVEIQQVDHTFQDKTGALTALYQVDLRVAPGEFVSLVGPSGCGKSTLLRLVAGLIAPSRGQIRLAGQPAAALRGQKEIGWMAAMPPCSPCCTVLDNVACPRRVNARPPRPGLLAGGVAGAGRLADFAGYYPAALRRDADSGPPWPGCWPPGPRGGGLPIRLPPWTN
jgi:NitT/TauT family transport system ATP-binding protein